MHHIDLTLKNACDVLQAKGIEDKAIASLLRKNADNSKSPELEVERLRIRLLNGRLGKPYETPSITRDYLTE